MSVPHEFYENATLEKVLIREFGPEMGKIYFKNWISLFFFNLIQYFFKVKKFRENPYINMGPMKHLFDEIFSSFYDEEFAT